MCRHCIRAMRHEHQMAAMKRQLDAWQQAIESEQYRNRDTFDTEA